MSINHEMNNKNIRSEFFKVAIPSVLSMWVFTIYTMVDGMFVARGVGETALAAVNISMPLINSAFGLGILWAVGASTRASIYKGRENHQRANEVFTLSTVSVAVVGLLFTVLTLFNLNEVAQFLGSTPQTHAYVKDYLSIIAFFFPFYMTSYNLEVLIKADGYPQKAVRTVLIGAVTNIILDYILVIYFPFGIRGAAVATGLSQLISFVIFMHHFLVHQKGFQFTRITFKIKESLALAKIGVADSLTEFSVASITFMFNQVILKYIGNDGVVIYTVISYVYQLVLMTMMGLNQGMQPLVSFYYGREEEKKYQSLFKTALVSAGVCSLVAFLLAQIYPSTVLRLFIDSSHVDLIQQGIQAFRLFSLAYLPLGFVVILYGYFTATEHSKKAVSISLSRGWIFVILSLAIMPRLFGEPGIWLSLFLSESLALIYAVSLFIRVKKQ